MKRPFGTQGLELDAVLLAWARDATGVFVPPLPELDAAYWRLFEVGFWVLGDQARRD